MPLTFKSTSHEELIMIHCEPDGRRRVAKAIQSDYNKRHWTVSLEHPSGQQWSGVCTGNKAEIGLGLTKLMADHEMEFIQDRARGDRPPASNGRDLNVRVDSYGRDVDAPIVQRR
jgi:hypothetical protein